DYDQVASLARAVKPKMIVAGYTAYPRTIDFARFKELADEVGALFLVDMAHISGLVAGKVHPSPVPYGDVVPGRRHNTRRGPPAPALSTLHASRRLPTRSARCSSWTWRIFPAWSPGRSTPARCRTRTL